MFTKFRPNMIFKSSKESLQKDILTKFILGSACILIPVAYFFYLPSPVNYVVLPFSLVGVIANILNIRKIIKYCILKHPYEFYILHICTKNKRTIKIVKGNVIGLPDCFKDLSIDEEQFLAIGHYKHNRSIKSQIESMKRNEQDTVVFTEKIQKIDYDENNEKDSKVKDTLIIGLIIFMIIINPRSFIELITENKDVFKLIVIFLFMLLGFKIFVEILAYKSKDNDDDND